MLEVLIAFLLVMICLVPLVREPLHHYRTEISSLERLETQRIADWTFTEIQEQLLKNEIPWESLPSLHESTPRKSLPAVQIQIPGSPPKEIPRFVSLYCKGEKEGLKGELYKLLYVRVYFSDNPKEVSSARFRLMVQKLTMEQKN